MRATVLFLIPLSLPHCIGPVSWVHPMLMAPALRVGNRQNNPASGSVELMKNKVPFRHSKTLSQEDQVWKPNSAGKVVQTLHIHVLVFD